MTDPPPPTHPVDEPTVAITERGGMSGRGTSGRGVRHDARVSEHLPSRPAARPQELALPAGYQEALREIKAQVVSARVSAARKVNAELIGLYHHIGGVILDRQQDQGWGAHVIDRLATDLRTEFPGMRGFSRSNLEYMRRFAAAVGEESFPQQLVGELAWGHVTVLLDRVKEPAERRFYAERAATEGWSRAVLHHLGEFHPGCGKQIGPPVPGRTVEK